MAAKAVRNVNMKRDSNGERYCRKTMRICELALNTSGAWEVSMLRPILQDIIAKYPDHFNGTKTVDE